MADWNTPIRWREFADLDLQTAEHIAKTMHPKPLAIICYHCQQAGEKYLKSFIFLRTGKEAPYIHDLDELCRLCKEISPGFEQVANICTELTEYGLKPKYPTELNIDENDAQRALNDAQKLRDFLRQQAPELFTE